MSERWESPIENYENVTVEDVKFLFAQAEKKLDDSVKVADNITSRNYTILTALVSLVVGLSGFFFANYSAAKQFNDRNILAAVAALYLLPCIYFFLRNAFPKQYYSLGSYPSALVKDVFFDSAVPNSLRTIYLYISEIENYEERIRYNELQNHERSWLFKRCLIAIYAFPALLAVSYIIIQVL